MRVIAGQFRSRRLQALAGQDTRPTSDRLRETVFDVLTAAAPGALAGAVWLDLFAGTGAVGIEALSRGARFAYFVESSARAAAVIRANLKSLGIGEGFEVIERDVARALRQMENAAVRADFIYLDPPYRMQAAYAEVLRLLAASPLAHSGTVVIAEHDKRFDPGERYGELTRARLLKQGDAALSFYRFDE